MAIRNALYVTVLMSLLGPAPALAEIITLSAGDDIEGPANALNPGDELVLGGGMYTLDNSNFTISATGTEAAPIVIRSAEGEVAHIHQPTNQQNILEVADSDYLVFRRLEFSGGSHGIRLMNSDRVTIENCEIHHTDDVAISANSGGEYEGLQLLRNHIHDTDHTGEGMYLGCNNDACRVSNSLIEGNWIHDTNGPSIAQGDGIEIKEGSYGNIVRDNVIHDTNYPCLITYSAVGNGAPNVLERNILWNCGGNGIQSAADTVIRNNIILSAVGSGIALQRHQSGSPSNIEIVHNTIFKASGAAIRMSNVTGAVLVANNALFAMAGQAIRAGGDTGMVTVANNVGVGDTEGVPADSLLPGALSDFLNGHYDGAVPVDAFPSDGSVLIGAASAAHGVSDDFNGTSRDGSMDVGAYVYAAGGNPGWTPIAGFKNSIGGAPPGGTDGGVGSDGGMPGVDSGTPTADGGTGFDGGTPGDGGSRDGDDEGCSCGTFSDSRQSETGNVAWVFLVLLFLGRRAQSRKGRIS